MTTKSMADGYFPLLSHMAIRSMSIWICSSLTYRVHGDGCCPIQAPSPQEKSEWSTETHALISVEPPPLLPTCPLAPPLALFVIGCLLCIEWGLFLPPGSDGVELLLAEAIDLVDGFEFVGLRLAHFGRVPPHRRAGHLMLPLKNVHLSFLEPIAVCLRGVARSLVPRRVSAS